MKQFASSIFLAMSFGNLNLVCKFLVVISNSSQSMKIIIVIICMNKSKSQPFLGSETSKRQFIYKQTDGMYIFQTKDLFMQVQFLSAIKQVAEYLQQYEKYCFLSQISSIGIKASEQKEYYQQIHSAINNQFQQYLEKSMQFVEQLIMNVQFMKMERWHQYSQIVRGYKTHILNKDIDCYDFQPEQFTSQLEKAMDYLKNIKCTINKEQVQQIKKQFKFNVNLIEEKMGNIYQNMFVKNPFKPQNLSRKEINSSQLFKSYMNKLIYQSNVNQSAIYLKFQNSYENIPNFYSFFKDLSIESQYLAQLITKQYNQNCAELMSKVQKQKYHSARKEQFQINQYYNEWKNNSKNTQILRNKIQKICFSPRIIVREQQTANNYAMLVKQQNKVILAIRSQDDELYQNRVPANNPYFDYWAHTYERDKLRKLQLYYQQPKVSKHNLPFHFQFNRQYLNKTKKKILLDKTIPTQNFYFDCISKRQAQESKIWNVRMYKSQFERTKYQNDDESSKNNYDAFGRGDKNELTKLQKLQSKIETYKKYHEKFEKQRKFEDQFNFLYIYKGNNQKGYKDYVAKFKIKDERQFMNSNSIFRYGIQIQRVITENQNVQKLQEFLFNFLKQKLYAQSVQYKQQMPLMCNWKSPQQFGNRITIKKLGEYTQTFKRYFIWSNQIIKYEEVQSINKQKTSVFTIYTYSKPKNSQALIFELKRRLNLKIHGQIVDIYSLFGHGTIESAMSKLELFHRLIFNQHMETPTAQLSFEKGRQLFGGIVKSLAKRYEKQM